MVFLLVLACGTSSDDPPDTTPPAEAGSLAVTSEINNDAPSKLIVSWVEPTDPDFKEVEITCDPACPNQSDDDPHPFKVAKGTKTKTISFAKGSLKQFTYTVSVVALDQTGNKSTASTESAEIFDYTVPEYVDGKTKYDELVHDFLSGYNTDGLSMRLKAGQSLMESNSGGNVVAKITQFDYTRVTSTLVINCMSVENSVEIDSAHRLYAAGTTDSITVVADVNNGIAISGGTLQPKVTFVGFLTANKADKPNVKTAGEHSYGCLSLGSPVVEVRVVYQVYHIKNNKRVNFRLKNSPPKFDIGEFDGVLRPAGNPSGTDADRLDFETKNKYALIVERLLDETVDASFPIFVKVTDVSGQ